MRRCIKGVFLIKNNDFFVIKRVKVGYEVCVVVLCVFLGYLVVFKRLVFKVEINLGIENKS